MDSPIIWKYLFLILIAHAKLKTIVSSNVEFQNGYILHRLDPSLTFNIARETDFKLYNIGIKVEGVQYTQVKPFVARYSKI